MRLLTEEEREVASAIGRGKYCRLHTGIQYSIASKARWGEAEVANAQDTKSHKETLKAVAGWIEKKGYNPADIEDFLAGVKALKRGEMPEEIQ